MTTVYLVTSGAYSDYGVNAVFSSRALAEAYIAKAKTADEYLDGPRVEEWVLDEDRDAQVVTMFRCAMHLESGRCEHRAAAERQLRVAVDQADVRYSANYDHLLAVDSPVSQEHAHKVAVEERQQWLATGRGEITTRVLR